ncbi:uncharacterized protein METZ01_LOCUS155479, partial [marine metagenome]
VLCTAQCYWKAHQKSPCAAVLWEMEDKLRRVGPFVAMGLTCLVDTYGSSWCECLRQDTSILNPRVEGITGTTRNLGDEDLIVIRDCCLVRLRFHLLEFSKTLPVKVSRVTGA